MDPLRLRRQKYPFSCGPACLAAAGQILGIPQDEDELCAALACRPDAGTCNLRLAEVAQARLGAGAFGCDAYQGGLAVLNILNPVSGRGHFVLALGRRGGIIRYADPFWCGIFQKEQSKIDFVSGCGRYRNWALNFPSPDLFCLDARYADPFCPEWALDGLRSRLERDCETQSLAALQSQET